MATSVVENNGEYTGSRDTWTNLNKYFILTKNVSTTNPDLVFQRSELTVSRASPDWCRTSQLMAIFVADLRSNSLTTTVLSSPSPLVCCLTQKTTKQNPLPPLRLFMSFFRLKIEGLCLPLCFSRTYGFSDAWQGRFWDCATWAEVKIYG